MSTILATRIPEDLEAAMDADEYLEDVPEPDPTAETATAESDD